MGCIPQVETTMSTSQSHSASSPPESLISRVFVTPLLFVSFLISLFLIDKQTYGKVLNGHGSLDDHYHSHQRKMAKQELEDAFHLRNKVLAAMFIFSGIAFALLGWSGSRLLQMVFSSVASKLGCV